MAASCERSLPPAERSIAYGARDRRGRMVPDAPYQTAGSPSLRGSVAAATEPSGAAGPPSTSSIACSCPRLAVERLGRASPGGPAPRAPRRRRARGAARGGPRPAARSGRPARRTSAARRPRSATSTPPSTSADTNWAWICGWASPPIEPATIHGPGWPSRNSIPGSSVWSVRLPGARTFGWSGSRLKYAAAVLVVDAGLRVDDAGAEPEVVRLDEADRVAVARRRSRGRSCRRRAGSSRRRGGGRARGSIRAASSAAYAGSSSRSTGTSRNAGSVR